jgi:predicted NAD/FAD-dependent oxidoreductase
MSTRRQHGVAFDHGAQYFTARHAAFRRELDGWIEAGVAAEWTGRIGTLSEGKVEPSSGTTTRYVGTPGMSAPARHLAGGLDVRSGVRILEVRRDGPAWSLRGEDGQGVGSFDVVLVTVPAPQAVPLLEGTSLADETRGARLRPCWAVLAAYDRSLDIPLDGAFVEHPALRWAARNSSKPGRPPGETWVLHAPAAWSETHLEDPPAEVAPRLLMALDQVVGRPLPPPLFSTAHRWRFALPDPPLEALCLLDPEARIGAGGDWCGGPRIEGAFLSGLELARQVLALPDGSTG